ncbi:Acyl transferase/acyl hydrolase/lysophospholipase [Arthroderma uncinatum]|uniref:Acyl transferase/acyl hydrolase/lysophospholipase n=1 Tax=Arthroderma uncinatum TaxID=74035 RepID=UPI00144AE0E8|nr:Acyl transferase/acyl hydrolase/lysophospholipase [Arthroderma uncinatum]KAF3481208.1 Acyl transferase/acyl hydrolase/lysophospholipase [Arthroderma uncinatum]
MMEAISLRQFFACVAKGLGNAGEEIEQEPDESDSDSAVKLALSDDSNDTGSNITTPDVEEEVSAFTEPVPLPVGPATSNLTLSRSDILECFGQVKLMADDKIREFGLDDISRASLAGSSKLCTALVVEAFDKLGSPLRTATPGQLLDRVAYLPQNGHIMAYIYGFLEREARLIDIDVATGQITRTHLAVPRKTSAALLEEMLAAHPESAIPNRLVYYAGKHLAGVLDGSTDGIRVIFGSAEGRQLVQAMYCDYAFNRMHYQQMAEIVTGISRRLTQPGQTLKVLEMGGGTGGTTNVMAPVLASLGLPVEYTFTDLSPSMVANARRKFSKQYPFMRFAVHDIEKPPGVELMGQHLVLASNAIHATHSLHVSVRNVRQALRPDGFLMMLEMTESLPFIDLVFGLLEGWWLFDDGRTHAIVPTKDWAKALHAAGYGHVDWTDGHRPENAFQKVIIALASGERMKTRLPAPTASVEETKRAVDRGDVASREADAERLVVSYTDGWATPALDSTVINVDDSTTSTTPAVVIVTGATGSLGAHLVQALAERPDVSTVVCVNRHSSSVPAQRRQTEAFSSRGIALSQAAQEKLRVYETDTTKPQLGLLPQDYGWLVSHATHIVHNAWPMSGTRPLKAFVPQMQTMRNLLDLAREMALGKPKRRIGFQFVSSIGVVGYADTSAGPLVIEDREPISASIPGGYTEAK